MSYNLPLDKFEQQVKLFPESQAAVSSEVTLSYYELNMRVNRLARYLRGIGVGSGDAVGISTRNLPSRLVAILAVLKSGGVYVPVDKSYPPDRLEQIIRTASINVLLCDDLFTGKRLQDMDVKVVLMQDAEMAATNFSATNLSIDISASDPMYIIFTSGSTGKPKAVVVSHSAYASHFEWFLECFDFKASDKWLQSINPCFDPSIDELFVPILVGGVVIFPDIEKFNPCRMISSIQEHAATFMTAVPTVLSILSKRSDFKACSSLKTLIVGGETFNPSLGRSIRAILPKLRVYNVYGPTEAAISVCAWKLDGCEHASLPIGMPRQGAKFYLREEGKAINASTVKKLAPGQIGELCISGSCLATEYKGDAKKTAEKFVPNPFFSLRGQAGSEKMYLTGDLCYVDNQGFLHFSGRIDDQVKIKGIRTELGEIEAALVSLDGVSDAAAFIMNKKLEAVIVADYPSVAQRALANAKTWIKKRLPEAIVPKELFLVDQIPRHLTSNKINRAKVIELVQHQERERKSSAVITVKSRRAYAGRGNVVLIAYKQFMDNLSKRSTGRLLSF